LVNKCCDFSKALNNSFTGIHYMALFGKDDKDKAADPAAAAAGQPQAGQVPPSDGAAPPPQEMMQDQGLPVDQVLQLKQQGYDDNQISQALIQAGYTQDVAFNTISAANMQGGAAGPVPGQAPAAAPAGAPEGPPGAPPMGPPGGPPMGPPGGGEDDATRKKIEEFAEVIIDEKWEEFSKNVNKLAEWKNKAETRITKIETHFKGLKEDFDNVHKALIGKIGEYDKNILGVGTEIKAMEKVFQKLLPTFSQDVGELSRLTRQIKDNTKIEKVKSAKPEKK